MILKAKQIAAASDASTAIAGLLKHMRAQFDKLRAAGLHARADKLEAAHHDLYMLATELAQDARETFAAARRGEVLS